MTSVLFYFHICILVINCDIIYVAFNNITTINLNSSTNYQLVVSPSIQKYKNNPFFGQNDSNQLSYFNVIYNPNSGNKTFEIFYNQIEHSSSSSTLKYAQSNDGLNWIFPNINIKYNNNIIMENCEGNGIWKDKYTNNIKELYKGFGIFPNNTNISQKIYGTATSSDGINWNNFRNMSINNRWDTQNNMFYDTTTSTYIGITRGIQFPPRTIARTQSNNSYFNSSFCDVDIVETGLGDNGTINQTYTQITFEYYNIYLGILMIYDTINQNVYCELSWSQDTSKWYRIGIGQQLIPLSIINGTYDSGMIFVAEYPVYMKNENQIRLYYMAGDGPHSHGPRNDSFALAYLRKDGYAGLANNIPGENALLESYELEVSGKYFIINIDILNNNDGYVRVGFKNITGYQIKDCVEIKHNVTDYVVTWNNNNDLIELIGTFLLIQFELLDAVIYTFGFIE